MGTTGLVDFNLVTRRMVNGANYIHDYSQLLIHLNSNSPLFAMEYAEMNIVPDVKLYRNRIV